MKRMNEDNLSEILSYLPLKKKVCLVNRQFQKVIVRSEVSKIIPMKEEMAIVSFEGVVNQNLLVTFEIRGYEVMPFKMQGPKRFYSFCVMVSLSYNLLLHQTYFGRVWFNFEYHLLKAIKDELFLKRCRQYNNITCLHFPKNWIIKDYHVPSWITRVYRYDDKNREECNRNTLVTFHEFPWYHQVPL